MFKTKLPIPAREDLDASYSSWNPRETMKRIDDLCRAVAEIREVMEAQQEKPERAEKTKKTNTDSAKDS